VAYGEILIARPLRPLFLCGLLLNLTVLPAPADFSGQVVGVIDGDSIRVMHHGKAEQVRLQGIACPNKKQAFGTSGNSSHLKWSSEKTWPSRDEGAIVTGGRWAM
jgi:endonuclease YncB( thermonuclease family)